MNIISSILSKFLYIYLHLPTSPSLPLLHPLELCTSENSFKQVDEERIGMSTDVSGGLSTNHLLFSSSVGRLFFVSGYYESALR